MATASRTMTIRELEQLSEADSCFELLRGELIEMPPAGFNHGDIALEIGTELKLYVRRTGSGRAAGAETGYVLAETPDVMLAPDASFVLTERLPPREERGRCLRLAPDLAVEVVSPIDAASYVHSKVMEYLRAGVRLVWVIDPQSRSLAVYDDTGTVEFLGEGDRVEGGNVLPDFSLAVADIFA